MKTMKKSITLFLTLGMAATFVACGSSGAGEKDQKYIGVAMPTQSGQRWNQDGQNMKTMLEEAGYQVDLQYAEDVVETQVSQIENMITKGVDVLVVAPVESSSLTDVVDKAADAGIPVISYDRLIMNTENVSYYATFDNFQVGVLQAEYIVDQLDLNGSDASYNLELFGGDPGDNNAFFFYDGAMSVLQPYIDEGKLVVKSGQVGMDVCGILNWDAAATQARMDNLLTSTYADGSRVDVVLSPSDLQTYGIISSLKNSGYGTEKLPLPIVTGQDAETAAIKSIIAGEQSMTIFKDTRVVAGKVVGMVQSILEGGTAEVNDTETYNNGAKTVESYLLDPVVVTIDNYKSVLIDSGYYTEAQLQ